MDQHIVTSQVARLSSGVLALTAEQAAPRARHLQPLGDGRYEITGTVEFKRGEVFGYVGELPKTLADNLTTRAAAEAAAQKTQAAAIEHKPEAVKPARKLAHKAVE